MSDLFAVVPTHEAFENVYVVSVALTTTAKSPEDAVRQMVTFVQEYATTAIYRVEGPEVDVLIDAETIDFNEPQGD